MLLCMEGVPLGTLGYMGVLNGVMDRQNKDSIGNKIPHSSARYILRG